MFQLPSSDQFIRLNNKMNPKQSKTLAIKYSGEHSRWEKCHWAHIPWMNKKVSLRYPKSHSEVSNPLSPFTNEAPEDDTSCLPHALNKRAQTRTQSSDHIYLSGQLPNAVREHEAGSGLAGSFIACGVCLSFSSPSTVNHVTNPGWDSQPLVMVVFRLAPLTSVFITLLPQSRWFSAPFFFFFAPPTNTPSIINRWDAH